VKPALALSPPKSIEDDAAPQREGLRRIAQHFFATAATVALLLALTVAVLPLDMAPAARWPLILSFGALGVLATLSMRTGTSHIEDLLALAVIASIAVITLAATLLDWGIAGPGIGFFGLLTCLVCAVAGLRMGLLLALLSACVVLGLAYAQLQAWLPAGNAAVAAETLGLRTLVHLFVIGAGLAGGQLVSRVVSRYVNAAEAREQRFRGLLRIAADAYWEIDAQYRLVNFKLQGRTSADMGSVSATGRVPWEMPEFSLDEDTLDLLRAHIEAREPFRDLPVLWLGVPGQVRHFVVSGEPRVSAQSAFCGYWGVARDVSAEVLARQALRATESRYQELFTRIPTPLVLHSQGHVLDANPAALDMFGFDDLGAMLGQDLLAAYESGDSRERARRRLETLQRMRAGEALPVAEYRLVGHEGRRIVVRGTGVRVDAHGTPAVLSIFVDDTERKKAEDAVRRSEAMLSHLVATSPDVITLTELATGRYAMVNRMFERHTGYAAAEVVGRSAIDIGIWRDVQDRERFVAAIRERGQVHDMPVEFVTKSGGALPMLVSGARFAMDRRDYLVINARDVSDSERDRLER
jgi:PAS domain S-box-containing protein